MEENTIDFAESSVIQRSPERGGEYFSFSPHSGRVATALFLVFILFATGIVMLFSWGVHRELSSISATTTLRHHVDHILLDMVSLGVAERLFSATSQEEHCQRFSQASDRLNRLLRNMAVLGNNNPRWKEWLEEVKRSIEVRRNLVRRQIVKNIQTRGELKYEGEGEKERNTSLPTSKEVSPSLIVKETAGQIIPNRLAELVAIFLHAEEDNFIRRKNNLEFLHIGILFSAIVALVCAFGLLFVVVHRFRQNVYHLRNYQSLLRSKNAVLEQRVRDRTSDLEAARSYAEKERKRVELLLQDASHRIGNSLAAVSSFLGLQLQRSRNDEVRNALMSARDRIQTIATAHRRLRLASDTETANVAPFLQSVVDDVLSTIPIEQRERICCNTHFEDYYLTSRDVTTLGIVLGELLINAVKHAFPNDRKGTIFVRFGKAVNDVPELLIEDSGIGFAIQEDRTSKEKQQLFLEKKKKSTDAMEIEKGLGKLVVLQLCKQFGTIPRFEQREKGGTRVVIALHKLAFSKIALANKELKE